MRVIFPLCVIDLCGSRVERYHKETCMPTGLTVRTPTLDIGYEAHGDATGFPIVLLHGFPDDVRAWDAVAPPLVAAGYRVLVPYLRGYGPTRFLDAAEPRMAQQAAIGQDVLDFMNALGVPSTYSFDLLTLLSGSIRDEALPRVAPPPPCPGSAAARCVVPARPWSRISGSGSRCSSRRIPTGSPSDAVRRSPRHDQGIPFGSIQSRARHRRS